MDGKANVIESYLYDAFGNLLERTSGTGSTAVTGSFAHFLNDILYAGEQYDEVTETYYLRARNYSPAEGRFLNEDKYHGDGRNLYVYVRNNPLRYIDPSGYCKNEPKVSGWKWALDALKIVSGAVLCVTGVGTAAGVSLIASGVGDVVVDVMTECGADAKDIAIVSDITQVVSGVGMLFIPGCTGMGVSSIASGAGGLVGGFVGEAIYESVTGEQSDTAFAVGSSVGNIVGGIVGDIGYNGVSKIKNATVAKSGMAADTIDDVTDTAGDAAKAADAVGDAGKGSTKVIPNAEQLKMSQTVQNHMNDVIKKGPNAGQLSRPYIDSDGTTLLLNEIMSEGKAIQDEFVETALRWDVNGSFRDADGIWELVVNTAKNEVLHFNFVVK